MRSFKRLIYKIGTTIPEIPHTLPDYFGRSNTADAECQDDYKPFTYSTAPIKYGMSILFDADIITTLRPFMGGYTGDGYQTLRIVSFEVYDSITNASVTNAAHLYYLGTEISGYPLNINIQGQPPEFNTGIEIGTQTEVVCTGTFGAGFTAKIGFRITDVNGDTGAIKYTYFIRRDI